MAITVTADSAASSPTTELEPWFEEIYLDVCDYLYHDRAPTGAEAVICKRMVNDGLRSFLTSHDWSVLSPTASITLWPTTTGTMAVTSSYTITDATNAPFLASMVGHTIVSESANSYTISAYTSSTVVTVSTAATADNGDDFTITPSGDYLLPAGFAYTNEQSLAHAAAAYFPSLKRTTPEDIMGLRANNATSSYPQKWAVRPLTFVATTGQQWELMVWPTPNTTYTIKMPYRINPDLLTSDSARFVGGIMYSEGIRACALREAERTRTNTAGPMAARAQEELQKAIVMDARMRRTGPIEIRDGSVCRRSLWTPNDTTQGITIS